MALDIFAMRAVHYPLICRIRPNPQFILRVELSFCFRLTSFKPLIISFKFFFSLQNRLSHFGSIAAITCSNLSIVFIMSDFTLVLA